METILIIIGILSIIQFIPKFVAVCLIHYLNKKHREKVNPIYYLSSDKAIWKTDFGEFYCIPTISTSVKSSEVEITVKWLNRIYSIAYYYKHADKA